MLIKLGRSLAISALAALAVSPALAFAVSPADASHKQIRVIDPLADGQKAQLHTYCVGPDSNLWMCCTDPQNTNGQAGLVLVYSPEGEQVRKIALEFVPTAINFSKKGDLFVSGSGKIARLDAEGKVVKSVDYPSLGNREQILEDLKKAAEEQLKQITESYQQQITQIEEQLAELNKEPEKPLSEKQQKRREVRVKALEQQLTQWKDMSKSISESYGSNFNAEAQFDRMKRSTGIAVSESDLFVSCPNSKGYGYGIWRMSHDLTDPVQVVSNVNGCCGQLDIQTDGNDLLVAANTEFKVHRFDRDGKSLASFGSNDRASTSGFGSCCNPMNIRPTGTGEILTAESSIGHIKRFSAEGEFLGYIGTARIGGGCKHVAIGVDPKRDWYYMMNIDRGNVAVLVPKSEAPTETEEERISREAREGLGKKLLGVWELVPAKGSDIPNGQDFLATMYGYADFRADGTLITQRPAAKAQVDGQPQPSAAAAVVTALGEVAGALINGGDATVSGENSGTVTISLAPQGMPNQNWQAIRQVGDTLEIVMVQDGVPGYGASIVFTSDDEAKFQWFYSEPSQKMGTESTYRRIGKADATCSEGDCKEGACAEGGKCEKHGGKAVEKSEESKPETTATTSVTSESKPAVKVEGEKVQKAIPALRLIPLKPVEAAPAKKAEPQSGSSKTKVL